MDDMAHHGLASSPNTQFERYLQIRSEISVQVRLCHPCPQQFVWETLENLLREDAIELSKEYRERVLLQIDHCLLELGQDPHFHSTRFESGSDISIRVNMIETDSNANDSGVDIKKLANIYCLILTDRELNENFDPPLLSELSKYCDDPYSARDLIVEMINENVSLDDVMNHPFHWSNIEKIDFICQVYGRIHPECEIENKPELSKKTLKALKKYGIDLNDTGVIIGSWIDKLHLLANEMEEITSGSPLCTVSTETIYNLAFSKKGKAFDEGSIFDLVRFFRNNHIHFLEKGNRVQKAFGDSIDGYWEFYFRRFPKLLIHLYTKMKCFVPYKVSAPFKHLPK